MLVRMTESNMPQAFEIIGDPGWIRTSDLQLRRLLLLRPGGTCMKRSLEAFFSNLVAGPAKPLIRWRARQDFDLVTSAFGGRGASQQGATRPCIPKFPLTS